MIVLLQVPYSQMTELINSKQVEDCVRLHAVCQNKSPGHTYLQRLGGGCLQVPLAGKPLSIIISVPVIPVEGILKVYWAMGPLCHVKNKCSQYRKYRCVLFSRYVMSNSLQPHGLQHTRLPCPLLSPRGCSNSRPLTMETVNTALKSDGRFCRGADI